MKYVIYDRLVQEVIPIKDFKVDLKNAWERGVTYRLLFYDGNRLLINIYAKKLLKDGVVCPVGQVETGVGRPQTLLDFDRQRNGVVDICLDYPRLNGGLADFSENIVEMISEDISDVKTLAELEKTFVDLLRRLVNISQTKKITLHSVCFATGGVTDVVSGRILNHVNFPLANGLDPHRLIGSILKVPAYVTPLGLSIYWGALEPKDENRRIFHVIWDLGIGTILGNGHDVKLNEFTKAKGNNLSRSLSDIGHAIWKRGGNLCHCGQQGCLEAYFGGWAMMRDLGETDWKRFLKRATDQDIAVKEIVTRCAQQLGSELAWIFTVYQPCKVRISGELPDTGEWVFDAFKEGLEDRLGKELAENLEPEYAKDFTILQVKGSCRIAYQLSANPLLHWNEITEANKEITAVSGMNSQYQSL
jgi:predicted NBD/HSP70 family sugar kinase